MKKLLVVLFAFVLVAMMSVVCFSEEETDMKHEGMPEIATEDPNIKYVIIGADEYNEKMGIEEETEAVEDEQTFVEKVEEVANDVKKSTIFTAGYSIVSAIFLVVIKLSGAKNTKELVDKYNELATQFQEKGNALISVANGLESGSIAVNDAVAKILEIVECKDEATKEQIAKLSKQTIETAQMLYDLYANRDISQAQRDLLAQHLASIKELDQAKEETQSEV